MNVTIEYDALALLKDLFATLKALFEKVKAMLG